MWLNTAGRRCGITPCPKISGNGGLNDGVSLREFYGKGQLGVREFPIPALLF